MVLLGAATLVQEGRRPAVPQPPGISPIGARNNKSPPRISTPSSLRGVRLPVGTDSMADSVPFYGYNKTGSDKDRCGRPPVVRGPLRAAKLK